MEDDRVLVTGGAGFIGSHLVEELVSMGASVIVVDNCSTGRKEWIHEDATHVDRDLRNPDTLSDVLSTDFDLVFHLAASKAVNTDTPRKQFEANTEITYNLLEAMEANDVTELAYTSSSTVYGEAPRPTPEDFSPLEPISIYGSSKLADEALCSAYAHTCNMTTYVFRFANIVGPRLRGAVIPDFINKLEANPTRLEILGNGRQEKSYMHITDCIDAILTVVNHGNRPMNIYNLGSRTTTSVNRIADIVSETLGYDPEYGYTGGERGWEGDVPKMRLSIEKLTALGWEPELESEGAVRRATLELSDELR